MFDHFLAYLVLVLVSLALFFSANLDAIDYVASLALFILFFSFFISSCSYVFAFISASNSSYNIDNFLFWIDLRSSIFLDLLLVADSALAYIFLAAGTFGGSYLGFIVALCASYIFNMWAGILEFLPVNTADLGLLYVEKAFVVVDYISPGQNNA